MNRWRRMIQCVGLGVCLLLTGCASEKPVATSENAPSPTPTPAAMDAPKASPQNLPAALFGLRAEKAANVVYLIDRSGSMIDVFDAVRNGSLDSIRDLNPKQAFQVVLTAKRKPLLLKPGHLLAATPKNKTAANRLLKDTLPEGTSDFIRAFETAFRLFPKSSKDGNVIFLVTDGDFRGRGAKVLKYLREANKDKIARINIIQCGNSQFKIITEFLKLMASENGGEFKLALDKQKDIPPVSTPTPPTPTTQKSTTAPKTAGKTDGGDPNGFFGAKTANINNIVYIMDRSGSMTDSFDPVRDELIRSVNTLSPEQLFYVLFAGESKTRPPLKTLVAATTENKKKVIEFTKTIFPMGRSEALPELKEAFRVLRDAKKSGQSIYLLTDGLPTKEQEAIAAYLKKANANKRVRINTFLYYNHSRSWDAAMETFLMRLARENGGEYRLVSYQEEKGPPISKLKRPPTPPKDAPEPARDVSFVGVHAKKAKNVIYLIDRSALMLHSFRHVRKGLNESIESLSAKQAYNVVFWGAKNPKMLSKKTLLPATLETQKVAENFIKRASPCGATNPLPALKAAMALLPKNGEGESVIFLLTNRDMKKHHAAMLKYLAPRNPAQRVRIYTIFYNNTPNPAAIKNLKQIAKENNGDFKAVKYGH